MIRKQHGKQYKKYLTRKMLHVLAASKVDKTAGKLLRNLSTGKKVHPPGLFYAAVLEGDYSSACARADSKRFYALMKIQHYEINRNGLKFIPK